MIIQWSAAWLVLCMTIVAGYGILLIRDLRRTLKKIDCAVEKEMLPMIASIRRIARLMERAEPAAAHILQVIQVLSSAWRSWQRVRRTEHKGVDEQ